MAACPAGRRAKATSDRAARAERAAALGITPERVMQEWALIAFADIARIADWGPGWFEMKDSQALAKADSAAISEVVAGGKGASRVKLFDKRAALEALARHLGMYEPTAAQQVADEASDTPEDPRELIVRRLAHLAAGLSAKRPGPEPASGGGDQTPAPVAGLGTA